MKVLKLILLSTFLFLATSAFSFTTLSHSSSWFNEDTAEKKEILNAFWKNRIINYNSKSVDNFKFMLINSYFPSDPNRELKLNNLFRDSIKQKVSFDLFFNSLKDEPLVFFKEINDVEKLIPNKRYIDVYPHLTQSDINNIQEYIRRKKLSVSVTLGSANSTLITPHFQENQYQYPFAIHSVGKVFTGILTLIMIEQGILTENDLNQPVRLDDSVLSKLPLSVRNQLKNVTLYQLMTHRGGLGDYLGKYCKVIASGHIPVIRQPEDFLPFVDDEVYSVGVERYSNAGILLVGLAIKHAYEEKVKHPVSYDAILNKNIINPIGITSFTPWKPEDAKYNLKDAIAPYIVGSPAGGYWITSNDLAKFGQWIYKKSKTDPVFNHLIKKYGQEFYHSETDTVAHGGGIPSSSAFLSVSLKTGAVLAIESNQSPGHADDLKTMIFNHIFSKQE